MTASRTGVLGGTFDPIHVGHLSAARAARGALDLERVLFIPSFDPPHRHTDPVASAFHRFGMVTLATASTEGFLASDVELCRSGPSFTAETLRDLIAGGLDRSQIFFITGADAFAEIATWREYPALLDLAHFVVCARPGFPVEEIRDRAPDLAPRMIDLSHSPGTALDGSEPHVWLLDVATPAVSSTEVRARARDGRPIAGLVPPEVESHIRRHDLYGALRAGWDGQARGHQLA
jgi:nicotinate-nucleotide adenylyltransferase